MGEREFGSVPLGNGRFGIMLQTETGMSGPDAGENENGFDREGLIKALRDRHQASDQEIAKTMRKHDHRERINKGTK